MSANKENTKQIVNKPITMVRDEFMEKLIEAANESGLPWCIIEYVVKDFMSRVSVAAAQEATQNEQLYKKQTEELGKKDDK